MTSVSPARTTGITALGAPAPTPVRREVRVDGQRMRFGPWAGDRNTALITIAPGEGLPTVRAVRRCLEIVRGCGYEAAVTGALTDGEQAVFRALGFGTLERLYLLSVDLREATIPSGATNARIARVPTRRYRELLDIDHAAFEPAWHLDRDTLDEALSVTQRSRLRAAHDGRDIVGYAIAGASGKRGFLQRVAVDPSRQHRGLGNALVADSMRWLRRRRVHDVVVNTQFGNEAGLALYERVGFRREPSTLAVLALTFPV